MMRERTFLHRPDVLLRAQRLRYPRTTELIWVKPGATSLAGSACASLWPQPQPYRTALCFRTLRSVATNLAGLVELSFRALGTSGERFPDAVPVSQRVFMSGHELDGELRVARAAQRLDALLDLGLACRKRGGADQLGADEALLLGLHEHQV